MSLIWKIIIACIVFGLISLILFMTGTIRIVSKGDDQPHDKP